MTPSKESVFKGWNFLKPKSGGANEAGEFGGVYQSADGNITAMIKQEASPSKNMAEFIGSQIFGAISSEDGAKVSLVVPDDFSKSKNSDSQVYVKSEFFKNYSSDMYVDMDEHMSAKTKPSAWFRKDGGRPLFMGSRNKLFKTLKNAFKEVKYQNFENIMPASLLIGDFDVHIGNIGVIRNPQNPKAAPKLVRIDFAGSLDKLTDNIYPHSRSRHLPGFGPTNHFREFPSELRRSPEFGDSLIAASKIDLNKTIDESFNELTKYYSNEAIAEFAKQSMPKSFNAQKTEEITPEKVKAQFKDIITKRQESLKEYGLEVKLTNLISRKYTFPYYEVKKEELKDLMKENPKYFKEILKYEEGKKGGKKLNLRNKSSVSFSRVLEILGIRKSAKTHLIKTIRNLDEEIKQEVTSGKVKKETKQKLVENNIDKNKEYVSSLEKFKDDDAVSVLPSQLGLSKKTTTEKDLIDFSEEIKPEKVKTQTKIKEQQDLLRLDEKDLEAIKHLKEKVLTHTIKHEKTTLLKSGEKTLKKEASHKTNSLDNAKNKNTRGRG